jgi:hypothetical protein
LLTAATGTLLLWRKAGAYPDTTKKLFLGLHNWEIVAKYVGVVLAVALITMTVTGVIMSLRSWRKVSGTGRARSSRQRNGS